MFELFEVTIDNTAPNGAFVRLTCRDVWGQSTHRQWTLSL